MINTTLLSPPPFSFIHKIANSTAPIAIKHQSPSSSFVLNSPVMPVQSRIFNGESKAMPTPLQNSIIHKMNGSQCMSTSLTSSRINRRQKI
jgi:hypothetical protein